MIGSDGAQAGKRGARFHTWQNEQSLPPQTPYDLTKLDQIGEVLSLDDVSPAASNGSPTNSLLQAKGPAATNSPTVRQCNWQTALDWPMSPVATTSASPVLATTGYRKIEMMRFRASCREWQIKGRIIKAKMPIAQTALFVLLKVCIMRETTISLLFSSWFALSLSSTAGNRCLSAMPVYTRQAHHLHLPARAPALSIEILDPQNHQVPTVLAVLACDSDLPPPPPGSIQDAAAGQQLRHHTRYGS